MGDVGNAVDDTERAAPERRHGRVVSATCFRVLSLQLETQNEVDVFKPILEELEVLRLSCVLGALPSVNPKDFEFDMLEAKEFDDEFARFLRANVFAASGDGHQQRGPNVRVVGLFGKQHDVRTQLMTLGMWDHAMGTKLLPEEIGLYAAVLPPANVDDIQIVVLFPWLLDEYFHADRLRETPTYLLRSLTCVTSHVTCCFSHEDKTLLEEFNLRDEDMGNGSDEEWQSYSAAFHVEQQQDAKDDVSSKELQVLPLPQVCQTAIKIDVVKGNYPAIMAIGQSPPSKEKKKPKRKDFSTPVDFCDWLLKRSNHFDLRVASQDDWSEELVEAVLKQCDEWPQEELDDITVTFAARQHLAEARVNERVAEELDEYLTELQAAGDELFQLDALLDEERIDGLISLVKARVQEVTAGTPTSCDSRRLEEYFENGHDEQLNEALEKAPVTLVKDMVSIPAERRLGGVMKSFWSSMFGYSTEVSDAFRARLQEPLQSMKQIWQAEFSSAYEAYVKERAAVLLLKDKFELKKTQVLESNAVIVSAFQKLLVMWSESNLNGLSIHFSVQHRLGRGIVCSFEEEVLLPSRDRVFVWSFKTSFTDVSSRQFVPMGTVDLADGEELRGLFTIQSRSALIVVVVNGHTVVRRVEFFVDKWKHHRALAERVRNVPRPSVLCDYYDKERLLVLVDVTGKAGVYRLDEKFKSMETVRTLNLALTSLTMPIKDLVLSDGILYMVDHEGAMQSLNTRNQQTSRKKQVKFPPSRGGLEDAARLVRVSDGSVIGWLVIDAEEGLAELQFVAAEDMRELPQLVGTRLPVSHSGLVYEVLDDVLVVMDQAAGTVRAIELTTSLKSESYRIRSTNGIRAGDTVVNAADANEGSQMLSHHWLWIFYHLYEKFPVRGELFRGATGAARRILELSFVCNAEPTHASSDFDDGCQKLLALIMEKLQILNKPLYGLDLAGAHTDVRCGASAQAAMTAEYGRVAPHAVATLLRELVTFVPVQICRAEFNSLTLMTDGQCKLQEYTSASENSSSLSSADIALKLRFGLLSPLLSSWNKQCIVVTSMGKQSTGKSYFLNHLTGSSFAISGARCTDGAWMSVRFLPNGAMLVVIDFEGLGSFERTEQEDVFLSVLNASVSMLTIFRMEMRLDKEIDELFSKFQKGSQLIKSDPQLFRGKLYMSVKDVNPNDQRGVVGEFVTKFQRLLEANKEQNFLTDMYAGQLDINCSPPLGTVGYYRSLSHAQRFIDRQFCGNPKAGFTSGKAFLDCIRLLLAKVSILDWTSLDESSLRMKIADVMKRLPSVLRFGAMCDGHGDVTTTVTSSAMLSLPREKLAAAATGELIQVSFDEVCALNPTLAPKWQMLLATSIPIDSVDDEAIDLGPSVSVMAANRTEAASTAIQTLFKTFAELVGRLPTQQIASKKLQHDFDLFLSFVIRRRCARVQKWCKSMFGDRVPEVWSTTERQALSVMQTLYVRCLDACSTCRLGCLKVSTHVAGGDPTHDCDTNHVCVDMCTYCVDASETDEPPLCSKPAGHEGRCECDKGDHTCGKPCLLKHAINCGKVCSKKAGHDHTEDHRCSVGLHKCGQWCAALNCTRQCVLDVEVPHTAHKCEVDRCLSQCIMDGCNRSCRSTDHFHGHTEAKIAFDVENPDLARKHGGTFDASAEKPTIHMCDEGHACPDMCGQDGICHIDVILKQSSKTFVGARGSFQYTFQEMNGSRKKCARTLAPGQMVHAGAHTCVVLRRLDDDNDEMKRADADVDASDQVIHYCDVRCPACSYYCQRACGHDGLHKTTHGNMRNTMFQSDENEIDLMDRKYAAGERGTAEMCNLFCSKMGRGHVHFLDCEKEEASDACVYQGSAEDMRRHCTLKLEPMPDKEQDEVLHERFWDTLGWEDPCASIQEREAFGKCAYKCDAPDHEDKEASYCVLPAWHAPVTPPADGADGCSYVSGHQFECSHVSSGNRIHHVFVLDASGSMKGAPWRRLNGAFREYVSNRITDGGTLDLVTVITFDGEAEIVWEAEPITTMAQNEAPFLGGGTSFSAALCATNEVISRMAFELYKPVIVFFSDGHPADGHEGDALASHIAQSYAKYGLEAFAVGFGHINLTVLQRIAERLGGSYCHVLTGDELKQTFHSISASLGARAGLVLTKPFHELICVICQKELASEATAVLTPCEHELHQRCLHHLMQSTGEGEATLCPTCRREFQPVVV